MVSIFFAAALACLAACNSPGGGSGTAQNAKQFPKPGAVVARDEMPVTGDSLNHFIFSVKVVADSSIAAGVYDIAVNYGPNMASGQFTMPKGGEDLPVSMRRGAEPYTFIVGFKMPGDTTFYDYYQVSATRSNTKMQYIKSYIFPTQ